MSLTLIAHELLTASMFWIAICRSARATPATDEIVRTKIKLIGISAIIGLTAPVYGWRPDVVTLAMTACFTTVLAFERRAT